MAIEPTDVIDVKSLTPFKKFIMTIGNIPTSYLESMSYAEILMWFCNYLQNTVIPTVNNNGEAVEELQNLYEEMREYVNDYFDNLDVQEEINNKLDAMVTDGSLEALIGAYINPITNAQDVRISALESEVLGLASGAPLAASSTSGMTDTSKIYVNTTNGKWYYYDGDSWEIGGTYQASESSADVNQLQIMTPKFAKFMTNNRIYLEKTSTHLNITTQLAQTTYFYTDNFATGVSNANMNTSFALDDFNINSSSWYLYVDTNDSSKIKLISTSQTKTWKPNCIIICIIRGGTEIITMLKDRIYFQNVNVGIDVKIPGNDIVKASYNEVHISDDTTAKTLTVTTTSSVPLIGNKYYGQMSANTNQTLSYDLSTSGNVLTIVYNINTHLFKIMETPSLAQYYEHTKPNATYTLDYGEFIIAYYNKATHAIFPQINQLYFNNNLVSIDKYDSEITSLQNQVNLLGNSYDFLRCFKNFTFIGDSLSAGYTSVDGHTINSATAKAQNNNWPSYLCSRLNREFTNLAQGNSTIANWRYGNQTGVPETNIENADITTGIYFVSLGVNDLRQNLTLGTSDDIDESDYTQNANSVYGNYDYIINKLKEFNPTAKIFTFTIPNSETNANVYNAAITYVSNLYDNVYCIDLYTLYDFSDGFINDNLSSAHYNPITYNYISQLIENAVNNYIYTNYTEFQLVPYNY